MAARVTLKSCPWCGSSRVTKGKNSLASKGWFGVAEHYVKCDRCGMSGPRCMREQSAVLMWNSGRGPENYKKVFNGLSKEEMAFHLLKFTPEERKNVCEPMTSAAAGVFSEMVTRCKECKHYARGGRNFWEMHSHSCSFYEEE